MLNYQIKNSYLIHFFQLALRPGSGSVFNSVADPRCLSRILNPGSWIRIFPISDPGSASKNLSILVKKMASKLSEIWFGLFIPDPDPGSRSWLLTHLESRGQKGNTGLKRIRIYAIAHEHILSTGTHRWCRSWWRGWWKSPLRATACAQWTVQTRRISCKQRESIKGIGKVVFALIILNAVLWIRIGLTRIRIHHWGTMRIRIQGFDQTKN